MPGIAERDDQAAWSGLRPGTVPIACRTWERFCRFGKRLSRCRPLSQWLAHGTGDRRCSVATGFAARHFKSISFRFELDEADGSLVNTECVGKNRTELRQLTDSDSRYTAN